MLEIDHLENCQLKKRRTQKKIEGRAGGGDNLVSKIIEYFIYYLIINLNKYIWWVL